MCYAILRVNDSPSLHFCTPHSISSYNNFSLWASESEWISASAKWNRNRSAFRDLYLAGFHSSKSLLIFSWWDLNQQTIERPAEWAERRRVQKEKIDCTKNRSKAQKKRVIRPTTGNMQQLHRSYLEIPYDYEQADDDGVTWQNWKSMFFSEESKRERELCISTRSYTLMYIFRD